MTLRPSVELFRCDSRWVLNLRTSSVLSSPSNYARREGTSSDGASPVQAIEEGEGVINEKKTLEKINWHVFPVLTILFFSLLRRDHSFSSLT